MASVTFDHVTKRYGDFMAIRDLDLKIEDGEFLVLVGPSGCGKSTALRMLAGLETISDGRLLIGDQVVNHLEPKDRNVAMVFQSYALYPHMTCYDNMAFSLRLRGRDKEGIDRRVKEAAELLGIEHLLERKPRQLSGGQRQRVAVGRAIVRNPTVMLMDEPLSNLDAKLRVQARTEISKLHQRLDTTFVYVTHDQVEAMTMGDRIAVLADGILQQADTPGNLYDRPANMFVAGFIGSPAMNLLPGTLRRAGDVEGGELVVDVGAFALPVPRQLQDAAGAHVGGAVVLGIRPEDLHDAALPAPDITPFALEAEVEVLEPMGGETVVYLRSGTHDLVARVDPRTQTSVGASLALVADLSNVHLFDAETEQAIR